VGAARSALQTGFATPPIDCTAAPVATRDGLVRRAAGFTTMSMCGRPSSTCCLTAS